jgi:hypothetical protein
MGSSRKKQTRNSEETVSEFTENASQGVDRIRDILFGAHIEEYELRFAELRKELSAKSEDLSTETEKKLKGLETLMKKEVSSLAKGLKEEGATRDQVVQGLDTSFSQLGERVEANTKKLMAEMKKDMKDLREDLSSQLEGLDRRVREDQKKLQELIEARINELQSSKTDQRALAKYLTEVADKLDRNSDSQGK